MAEDSIMRRVRELCLCCQDCKEFYRHYILDEDFGEYVAIQRGHCASPHKRTRNDVGASDIACRYFEMREGRKL